MRFYRHLFSLLLVTIFTISLTAATGAAETIYVDASGYDGRDGQNGVDYKWSRAMDGWNGSPGMRGSDGQRGRDGGNASASTRGGDGGTIRARLEWITGGLARLTAQVNGVALEPREVNLTQGDRVVLLARGGRGGNGGLGGSGEEGGRGGKGGDASKWNRNSGDGGRGGDGGMAGQSSDASHGGNGGRVLLEIPAGDQKLLEAVSIDVSGGRGGQIPIGTPSGGRGGDGGEPGNHCFYGDSGYECGFRGMRGIRGMDGRANYYTPRTGIHGSSGTYEIREY